MAQRRRRQARRLTQAAPASSSPQGQPSQGLTQQPSQGLTLGPHGIVGDVPPASQGRPLGGSDAGGPDQAGPQGGPPAGQGGPQGAAQAPGPVSMGSGPAGADLGPVPKQVAQGTQFNIDQMQRTTGAAPWPCPCAAPVACPRKPLLRAENCRLTVCSTAKQAYPVKV